MKGAAVVIERRDEQVRQCGARQRRRVHKAQVKGVGRRHAIGQNHALEFVENT
jgi:hypothetical protein